MQPKRLAIGVFTMGIGNYYFGGILRGIHAITRRAGVPLTVIQGGLKDHHLPALGADHVAAWIVIHPTEDDRANLAALVKTGVPVVTIATALNDVACSSVVVDNRGATQELVNHLIDHGHQRIACIVQRKESWSRDRYQGYIDALRAHDIPLDPALVIDPDRVLVEEGMTGEQIHVRVGQIAAHELIARGMPCSALVAGTDLSALTAMQLLQDAGYRIPEDVAVVGFDDIAQAQYATPSLTTVRTRFDEFGRAAAEHLLGVLRNERDAQPTQIFAPTLLLRRSSCGCAGVEDLRARSVQTLVATADWHSALARQLVEVVSYPLTPDPATPPAQIWPGVQTLISAVKAALQGQDTSSFVASFEVVWQRAVALTENLELLNTAVRLLEDAAEQRLSGNAARRQLSALFDQIRMEMMRARLGYEASKNQYLKALNETNQEISQTLLSSKVGESRALGWLRKTPVSWGCLGLWEAQSDDRMTLAIAGEYERESTPRIAIGTHYAPTAFPPFEALPSAAQQGQDLTIICPVRAEADELGVLALCGFAEQNLSIDTGTLSVHSALLGATLKRDALVTALETQAQVLAEARDAAQAANAAKSAFLASMSHELRTPLNGILGYAQILTNAAGLTRLQADGLRTIQQCGEHLLTLIDDVLDLAKIEAGKLELVPANLHLNSFLEGIIGIIRARAETKRLKFSYEPLNTLPSVILADEKRLRQILLNLLGNAIKFTEHGSVTLRVKAEGGRMKDENWTPALHPSSFILLTFEVEDTGIGIPLDQRERIFQPFEQVGDVRLRAEGTGLGLAISQRLLQQMGSTIELTSHPGQGSTFAFTLSVPLIKAYVAQPPAPQIITGYCGPPRTVLVVDDIADNRAVLTTLLSGLGFRVYQATNGEEALAQAMAQQPDLILMDRSMPVLDGREAIRRLRQLPTFQTTPIIAVSASVSVADRAQSLAAGADAFVPKPIHQAELLVQIGRLLQLKWTYQQPHSVAETATEAQLGPPAEQAQLLYELAHQGRIQRLHAQLDALEQRGPQYTSFVAELRQLARRYRTRQIEALLEAYLREGSDGRPKE